MGEACADDVTDAGRACLIAQRHPCPCPGPGSFAGRDENGKRDVADVAVGDSIAINGCCLTIVEVNGSTLSFDVSAETLRCTIGLDRVGDVNLEMALRLSDRLGGHLMTGHVDSVGTVTRFDAVAGDAGGSWSLEIEAPAELARFIAAKGSIAVHGVSLTVNGVAGSRFHVNLPPQRHVLSV